VYIYEQVEPIFNMRDYISYLFSCKKSSHRNIQFYPLCTGWFFLSDFSRMKNEYDVLASETYRLGDPRYLHLWKL
jgi:hypothetical protein